MTSSFNPSMGGANIPAAAMTKEEVDGIRAVVSSITSAPSLIDASNAASINGRNLYLASGSTLTVNDSAWQYLTAGIVLQIGQSSSATLAFSGSATKENKNGINASNFTLLACGTYSLTQSPSGSGKFRVSGGDSL